MSINNIFCAPCRSRCGVTCSEMGQSDQRPVKQLELSDTSKSAYRHNGESLVQDAIVH